MRSSEVIDAMTREMFDAVAARAVPPPSLPAPDRLAFRLACVPPKTSHHAKRIVKHGRFSRLADSDRLVEAKETLDSLLLPYQPTQPIAGPVRLAVTWCWPWLAGHGRAFRAAGTRPHTSKPDLSNVLKTLEDRLVRLRFIEDDRAVVEVRLRKVWGGSPGIDITIEAV